MQLNDDPLADGSFLGGVTPADMVLELADCEAFVAMHDQEGNGTLSANDLSRLITAHMLNSIRTGITDDSMSLG